MVNKCVNALNFNASKVFVHNLLRFLKYRLGYRLSINKIVIKIIAHISMNIAVMCHAKTAKHATIVSN